MWIAGTEPWLNCQEQFEGGETFVEFVQAPEDGDEHVW